MDVTTVGVALLGFLSAWVWNEIFLRFARRLGALSQGIPNQRRWDSRKKPIIGGIAFFIFSLGIAAWRPADMQVSRALLAGGTIAFLTGLADDAFVSLPYIKLLGQLVAAGAAIVFGGPLLELPRMPVMSVLFTLFWYAAVMNALNMMDNMDGIAGSLSLLLLLNTLWLQPEGPHALLYVGLVGALVAFLLRNFHPSHLYMGDNGSQFLGFILAYWGTEMWNAPALIAYTSWAKVLLLVLIFALLAGDTFWVSLMRLREGRSPFHGGTDHLTHRLARIGISVRSIALLLALTQGMLSILLFFITTYHLSEWVIIAGIVVIGLGIGAIHTYPIWRGVASLWEEVKKPSNMSAYRR